VSYELLIIIFEAAKIGKCENAITFLTAGLPIVFVGE
jgi:hypothetical protein